MLVTHTINLQVAGRLEEAARLLHEQGADPYRVRAYRRAALSVRASARPVDEMFRQQGIDGLKSLRGVGDSIARAIRELVVNGRLPMLDRLRGEADPVRLLASVPSIGFRLADRLHEELGLETLADLEAAAHDGRLERRLRASARSAWPASATRWRTAWDACAGPRSRRRCRPSSSCSTSIASTATRRRPADCRESRRAASIRTAPRGSRCSIPAAADGRIPRSFRIRRAHTGWGKPATGSCCTKTTAAGSACTRSSPRRGPLTGWRVVAGREMECEVYYAGRAA